MSSSTELWLSEEAGQERGEHFRDRVVGRTTQDRSHRACFDGAAMGWLSFVRLCVQALCPGQWTETVHPTREAMSSLVLGTGTHLLDRPCVNF